MIYVQQMPPAQAFDTAIELLPSANRPTKRPGIVTSLCNERTPMARGILFA